MPKTDNPLAQYFRQPAIYIRLPSGGKTWPAGSLDLPANGEVPVYPMTAMDEITYRTPDALFNGEATVSVLQSCIPNIKDGWKCPATDLDALLVAIRIASYGHQMDISSTCPKCETDQDFGLDLRTVIDGLRAADYSQSLDINDLKIYIRPLDYQQMTDSNQLQFEQQKLMQLMNDGQAAEASKVEELNKMMRKIMAVTVTTIAQSIGEIRANGAIVTDTAQIEEFLNNCERKMFESIRDHVVKLREQGELKPLKITCPSCQHEYEQAFTLDMARFFGYAS